MRGLPEKLVVKRSSNFKICQGAKVMAVETHVLSKECCR